MALEAGTRLDHYEVVSSLGAGGMGEVYRAKDTKLRREVAIKLRTARLLRKDAALVAGRQEADGCRASSQIATRRSSRGEGMIRNSHRRLASTLGILVATLLAASCTEPASGQVPTDVPKELEASKQHSA